MSENTTFLLIILGALVAIVITMTCHRMYISNFTTNIPDPLATTKMELISEKIYEIIKKNQEDQEDYNTFINDLKTEGIDNPKIDMKFYMTIAKAYQSRLLTRAFIMNRLES
jgi:hypothetical protein